jgi:hypothetical protein
MVEILGVLPGCVGVPKVLIGGVKARVGDDKAHLSLLSITLWRNKETIPYFKQNIYYSILHKTSKENFIKEGILYLK